MRGAAPRRLSLAARLLVTLAVAAASPGCLLLPTLGGPPPPLEAPAPAPRGLDREGPPLLDLRGVIHCHSEQSHDSPGTLERIAVAARETGVRFVFMTDHFSPQGVNEGARGVVGGVLFAAGAELSRDKGSLLAVAVGDASDPRPGATPVRAFARTTTAAIEEIRAAGGLSFVGHAEEFQGWASAKGVDGIEVVNLHAAAKRAPWWLHGAGLVLPPGAYFRRVAEPDPEVLARWDALSLARRTPGFGGCDAHASIRVFGPLGGTIGDYPECFRAVTTHLLATSCTARALCDALREGRGYVAFEIGGDATGFAFDLVDGPAPSSGRGRVLATMGGEARLREGMRLLARAPGGDRARVAILRDGVVLVEGPGAALSIPVEGPGVYRAEATLDGRPLALSNPIHVR